MVYAHQSMDNAHATKVLRALIALKKPKCSLMVTQINFSTMEPNGYTSFSTLILFKTNTLSSKLMHRLLWMFTSQLEVNQSQLNSKMTYNSIKSVSSWSTLLVSLISKSLLWLLELMALILSQIPIS